MATTATSAQTAEHTAAERATHARTICEMALTTATLHSDGAALRFARDGEWTEMSYAELGKAVSDIARGLMALGIEPGDRVSILSGTRAEWTLADLGALCAGAVVAPIYHTNSPEECGYVLEHAGSRVVFCENAEQVAKVRQVADGCPDAGAHRRPGRHGRGRPDAGRVARTGREHRAGGDGGNRARSRAR